MKHIMKSSKSSQRFSAMFCILLLGLSSIQISCNASKKTKGAVIGATVGAVVGAMVSKKNKAATILVSAAVGGVAGALIGNYMDKQAAEIKRDLEGAKVERVGEGIVVTFDSGLLFDFDSHALKSETKENLARLSNTLKKYEDTDVIVFGHTDNTGASDYNVQLSQKRAQSVQSYLNQREIPSRRLETQGLGETDPIASNESEAGRQENRRVELTIMANKKLIRDAKKGKIPGV